MKMITLEDIKSYSRIDTNDDDKILELMGDAAEEQVYNYLGKSYDDLIEQYGVVPSPVKVATLAIVDTQYQNRSLVSATDLYMVPYAIDMKLLPYKIL